MADAARRLSNNAASCTASSRNAPRNGRILGGGTGGAAYVWQRGGDGGWSFAQVSRAGGSATGGGGGRATTGLATSAGRAFSLPRLRLTYVRHAFKVKGSQPPPAAARASATRLSFRALCILVGGHASPCQLAIFPKPRAGSPPAPRRSPDAGARLTPHARHAVSQWHKNASSNGWCGVPRDARSTTRRILFVRVVAVWTRAVAPLLSSGYAYRGQRAVN